MNPHHDALTLAWLVRLRWASLLGTALLAIMIGPAMHLMVPTGPLAALGATMGLSNLAVQLLADRQRDRARSLLGGLLLIDGALLTAALYLTGGATNPFAASYLLLVVLAAATLGRRAGGVAVTLAVIALATVAVVHRPLVADHDHASHAHDGAEHRHPPAAHHHDGTSAAGSDHIRLHARGTGVVFAILAALVVYLVSWALRQREVQLEALRAEKVRHERLADVGAFATSTAHELGSPLATIAVVAKELERTLQEAGDPGDTVADAQAIREQVDRCREILDELARVDLAGADGVGQPRAAAGGQDEDAGSVGSHATHPRGSATCGRMEPRGSADAHGTPDSTNVWAHPALEATDPPRVRRHDGRTGARTGRAGRRFLTGRRGCARG